MLCQIQHMGSTQAIDACKAELLHQVRPGPVVHVKTLDKLKVVKNIELFTIVKA